MLALVLARGLRVVGIRIDRRGPLAMLASEVALLLGRLGALLRIQRPRARERRLLLGLGLSLVRPSGVALCGGTLALGEEIVVVTVRRRRVAP